MGLGRGNTCLVIIYLLIIIIIKKFSCDAYSSKTLLLNQVVLHSSFTSLVQYSPEITPFILFHFTSLHFILHLRFGVGLYLAVLRTYSYLYA